MSIVLPVSRNAVITAGLFAFLFSWSDFLFALTLTTGTNLTPVTLGIYSYLGGEIQSWPSWPRVCCPRSRPSCCSLRAAVHRRRALNGAVK